MQRPQGIRVRTLCVHDMTTPTLQMLGTRYGASFALPTRSERQLRRYIIEPFFFTSSVNWIPSRYQEAPTHGEGDRKSMLRASGWYPDVDVRYHCYPTIRTNTAFDITQCEAINIRVHFINNNIIANTERIAVFIRFIILGRGRKTY